MVLRIGSLILISDFSWRAAVARAWKLQVRNQSPEVRGNTGPGPVAVPVEEPAVVEVAVGAGIGSCVPDRSFRLRKSDYIGR